VAAGGDIVREAPGLAARLAALTGELERPALRLEARTVVRLLLDGAVSDAEARRLLSRLDPTGAREVIERLSRAAPARAARLIRAAAGSTPEGDRGQALVSGSTEEG
jgi:hypothetical protein